MKTKGFTLIELLVVISLIAVFSSVVLASLNAAREKARIGGGRQFDAGTYRAAADQAVGIWDFDECSGTSTPDRSSNGNDAELSNVTWSTDTASGIGCSASFNGSTSVVASVGTTDVLNVTGDLTITAWIKPSGWGESQAGRIFEREGVSNGYRLQISQASQNFGLSCSGNTLSSNPNAVTLDTWQHVAAVKSGTNVSFYRDGQSVGVATGCVIATNPWGISCIGDNCLASRVFNGKIDQVRVYAKSLTAAAVRGIYAQGAGQYGLARGE